MTMIGCIKESINVFFFFAVFMPLAIFFAINQLFSHINLCPFIRLYKYLSQKNYFELFIREQ